MVNRRACQFISYALDMSWKPIQRRDPEQDRLHGRGQTVRCEEQVHCVSEELQSKKGYSSVQQGSWGVSLPQSAVSLLQLLVFADLKG